MTIGENIKKVRKSKGVTQKQLAEATGIAEATIIRYEKNKFKPNVKQVEKIAIALDVTPVEIMEFDYWNTQHDTDKLARESKLFEALMSEYGDDVASTFNDFLQLNDEGQRKASEYIDDLMQSNKYKKE